MTTELVEKCAEIRNSLSEYRRLSEERVCVEESLLEQLREAEAMLPAMFTQKDASLEERRRNLERMKELSSDIRTSSQEFRKLKKFY